VPNLHKKTQLFLALILAVVFTFGEASNVLAEENIPGLNSLGEVIQDVQLLHISEPDSQTLIRGAIDGLINTLNDPYTVYMSPEDLKNFRGSLEGDYVGIGVQLQPGEIYPKVLNAMENTPASEAGIESGDMIIKIDGLDISGEPLAKVVEKIRGLEGTKITLTIRREGMADFDIILTRSNISTPTVTGKILGSDIAYIRINTFGDFTKDEFDRTLDDLLDQGAAKMILDLRDNPGGLIHSVVEVSSYFIDEGDIVVSTVDRAGMRDDYLAERGGAARGMPIVVLVDGYTASAAEILAGALQDYDLAVLIGGQTFGKGTVQAVVPLDTGGALKITVARYHTPADRIIDGTGLTPDIQVLTPYLSEAMAQVYLSGAEKNTVVFDKDKSEAEINGIAVKSGQVIQRQGINYLPLRFLFEALGYRVDWLQDKGSINITGFQTEAVIYPADGHYMINSLSYPGEGVILSDKESVYIQDSLLKLFDAGIQYENNSIIIEKTL
jgi:carboxyl-terminal processing protease